MLRDHGGRRLAVEPLEEVHHADAVVSAAGALLVVLLVGVSLAGASSSYKRYTVPAAFAQGHSEQRHRSALRARVVANRLRREAGL